ncbi:hypothetical protein E4656_16310 [Natronospirillum operosum]|uniref:Uncharacterized protein n=1 Tax=Natronospirillum operosum TaxID=2759953 RepID=A0A4Z0W5L4_9GAMM|nr:hypothetical protein [Natronospirillum operosum]TGG91284.1 hypothetical protein E4656_16310 [Natronospirillum operosum]
MKVDYDPAIVLDRFGNVDVQFYEEKARRMRSEAFFHGLQTLARTVRTAAVDLGTAIGKKLSHSGSVGSVSRQA